MNKYVYRLYKETFPKLFEEEKKLIKQSINGNYQIEHIGSTAVPGLGGKGIIDIMIGTTRDEVKNIVKKAEQLGYIYIPQASIPNRLFLRRPYPDNFETEAAYHLQVVNRESDEWKNALSFRDYLRTHPDDLTKYAKIKQKAAEKADEDKDKYMNIKEGVIKGILKKALVTA